MFNENEKKFIEEIEEAKKHAKGELELDLIEGEWFAMDYRSEKEGAFFFEDDKYSKPLITEEEAKEKNINVIKCCDDCDVSYVE